MTPLAFSKMTIRMPGAMWFAVYTELGRVVARVRSPPPRKCGCGYAECFIAMYRGEACFRLMHEGDGMDNGKRVLITFARQVFLVALLACLGCLAQSSSSDSEDVMRALERKVRVMFSVPPAVKVNMGTLRPSEVPGYDAVTIKFDDPQNKQ